MKSVACLLVIFMCLAISCSKKNEKEKIWVYTSLYKDTVSDLKAIMEKEFPGADVQFYQAGSEELALKIQTESLSGKIQADIVITSDRFWLEDMAQKGVLLSYRPQGSENVDATLKSSQDFYSSVSLPVMVLAYNSEVISEKEAPRSFIDLKEEKWMNKISIGSPLASGTSFTTVAFLVKKYGWDYFKSLRKNNFIAEGGNSGVIRRLQSKERPVGIVLLENLLRLRETDPRIKTVIPGDGAIMQVNALGIVKKSEGQKTTKQVADFFFSKPGQEIMVRYFMYATVPGYPAPKGAVDLSELHKNSFPWEPLFISETMKKREEIKNIFSKIIF